MRSLISAASLCAILLFAGCLGATNGSSSKDTKTNAKTEAAPVAVIEILVNGTSVYSSAHGSMANGTHGNLTGNGTTSPSGNGSTPSASGNSSHPSPSHPSPSGNASGPTPSGTANATHPSGPNSTGNPSGGNGTGLNASAKGHSEGPSVDQGMNVTFDASKSTGTGLNYTWTIGNDTFTNVSVTMSFNATGPVHVVLHVADGANHTDEAKVTIAIVKRGPAPGSVVGYDNRTFSASPSCGVTDWLGSSKTATFSWNFTSPDANGTNRVVGKVSIKSTTASALKFLGPDGKTIASGTTSIDKPGSFAAGEYQIQATRACSAPSSSAAISVTASGTYVAS